MIANRRSFLKYSSLFSCVPLFSHSISYAQHAETPGFYSVDEENNLYLSSSVFPYERTLLLSINQTLDNEFVYDPLSKVFSIGELTETENPSILIISAENDQPVLVIASTDTTNLENPKLHYLGKLTSETLDNQGKQLFKISDQLLCILAPTEQQKIKNPNLEFCLLIMDRFEKTLKVLSVEKENEKVVFKMDIIDNLTLPFNSTFHIIPKAVFDHKNHYFLIVDNSNQQHQYFRLSWDFDNCNYFFENVLTIEDNDNLGSNWNFRFSPISNSPKKMTNQKDKGDFFYFLKSRKLTPRFS